MAERRHKSGETDGEINYCRKVRADISGIILVDWTGILESDRSYMVVIYDAE